MVKIYFIIFSFLYFCHSAIAQQDSLHQRSNLHFQATYIYQYKPAFTAPYSGAHSIQSILEKQNSLTATLYLGLRLWKGAEVYINPEVAGGSGLSGAFGMAASTNGETFRVGDPAPSLYLARGYFKQTILLGGESDTLNDQPNQLRNIFSARYFSLVIGKFSLGDFFDNNEYSNSPRTQFINWALMNNSAWDYAANLRGYTTGAAAMLKYNSFIYKISFCALPKVANGNELNQDYGTAHGINAEVTNLFKIKGRTGHVRVLGYYNETNMGNYTQAFNYTDSNGAPNVIASEKPGRAKKGLGVNADFQLSEVAGVFARMGWNDGKTETWAFTEADRTISAGLHLNGKKWKRANDNIGIAIVANGLAPSHKNYLAAGGYGFQLGDGKLNYTPEMVTELFYSCQPIAAGIWLSADYQLGFNPGYNKDRGPVNVFSLRVHVEL